MFAATEQATVAVISDLYSRGDWFESRTAHRLSRQRIFELFLSLSMTIFSNTFPINLSLIILWFDSIHGKIQKRCKTSSEEKNFRDRTITSKFIIGK
jgi:hypothetical protein